MSKAGKFWLTLVIGIVIAGFTLLGSYDEYAQDQKVYWGEVLLTILLFSLIAAIIGGLCDEYQRKAGGWWTFIIGVIFLFIGGVVVTKLVFVSVICGVLSVAYGFMVGAITVKEKSDRGKY